MIAVIVGHHLVFFKIPFKGMAETLKYTVVPQLEISILRTTHFKPAKNARLIMQPQTVTEPDQTSF